MTNDHAERIRRAFERFDLECLKCDGSDCATPHIALMDPRIFLRLAAPISETSAQENRLEGVQALLNDGTPFSSIPELEFSIEDGQAVIFGHEGRHRAVALAEKGVREIPVLLITEDCPGSDLGHIDLIHPEPHDYEEEYRLDEDELAERLCPVLFNEVFATRISVKDILECLEGSVMVRTPALGM